MTMNFMTGLIAAIIGGIYLVTTMMLPEMTMGDRLGPKLFPTIVGLAAVLAGIALMVKDRMPGKASKKANFGFVTNKAVWIKILITTVLGIAYGLAMDPLGFIIPTTIFMFCIATIINKGRLVQNAVIGVAFSVITYGIFGVALQLSLPRGFLEQLLPF